MNKNYKIIKINGFRGVLIALFALGCAVTGFVVFPGWLSMHLWNYCSSYFASMPQMEILHGVMLWAIVALSIWGLNNNKSFIGFTSQQTLHEEQIRDIMNKVKANANADKVNNDIAEMKETETSIVDSFDELRK